METFAHHRKLWGIIKKDLVAGNYEFRIKNGKNLY